MDRKSIFRLTLAILAMSFWTAPPAAFGQTFPNERIRIVVPFPAGGTVDTQARLIGEHLSERWKQPVIVDPRPGAVTMIGTREVVNSEPNGHTLLFTSIQYAFTPALMANLPYDPLTGLVPITTVTLSPETIIAHPSVPAENIKELLELARARPGELNLGTPGNELTSRYFNMLAGVKIVSIPFKGGAPMMTNVMGGNVQLGIGAVSLVQTAVRSGRVRLLGVAASKPSASFPNASLIPEIVPGFEVVTWFGLFAPGGTPKLVVDRIRDDVATVLEIPKVRERLLQMGGEPGGETQEEFAARVRNDIARWQKVGKEVGIKPQ